MLFIDKFDFFTEEYGDNETKSVEIKAKSAKTLTLQKAVTQQESDEPQGISVTVEGRIDPALDYVALSAIGSGDITRYDLTGLSDVRVNAVFGNVTTSQGYITLKGTLTA